MPQGPKLLCTVASEARRRVRAIGLQRRSSQIVPVCCIPFAVPSPRKICYCFRFPACIDHVAEAVIGKVTFQISCFVFYPLLPTGRPRQRNHDLGVDAPVREPVGLVRKMRKRDGLRDNASMLRRILLVSGSWHEHPPGHQPTLPACQVHVQIVARAVETHPLLHLSLPVRLFPKDHF